MDLSKLLLTFIFLLSSVVYARRIFLDIIGPTNYRNGPQRTAADRNGPQWTATDARADMEILKREQNTH